MVVFLLSLFPSQLAPESEGQRPHGTGKDHHQAVAHGVGDACAADLIRGKRILIIDDVISTGGSLKAMEALITAAGGTVAGRIAVLAEGGAKDRDDIKFLAPLPLFNADGTTK